MISNAKSPATARQVNSIDSPQSCAQCGRAVKVPWMVIVIVHPSQPAAIRKACASCAASIRYAGDIRQLALCREIAAREFGKEAV